MKCQKLKKQLSLLAGEDLPDKEAAKLLSHLKQCKVCASELAAIKRSRERLHEIARHDVPEPLPHDFSQSVSRSMTDVDSRQMKTRHNWLQAIMRHPVRTAAATLAVFGMAAGSLFTLLVPREITPDQLFAELQAISGTAGPELSLEGDTGSVIFKAFDEPSRLDTWDSPTQAGIYVILHKRDPENRTAAYVVDYCGQGRNLSLYKSHPWIEHRKRRLISRTGSPDNVYIAVFPMPGSTRQERRRLERALIKTLKPYFNTEV